MLAATPFRRAERACSRRRSDSAGSRPKAQRSEQFWDGVREQTDRVLFRAGPLWRLSLPPARAAARPAGRAADRVGRRTALGEVERAGAQRCARPQAAVGGHATLFRGPDRSAGVLSAAVPALARLHRELKAVFDPAGILNPRPAVCGDSRPCRARGARLAQRLCRFGNERCCARFFAALARRVPAAP